MKQKSQTEIIADEMTPVAPALAAALNPQRMAARAEREMRRCAVYDLHEVPRMPDRLIALDRQYKPLGFGWGYNAWVDYAAFPDHHFLKSELDLSCLPDPRRPTYLFDDGTAPWRGTKADRLQYRQLLLGVFGTKGVQRLSRLCGFSAGAGPRGSTEHDACICVAARGGRECIVKVYRAAEHGGGFAAYRAALRDAPQYGSAAEVTVDLYPPRHASHEA